MEKIEYPAINSEKTISMKHQGYYFIMNGLFVDGKMHISTYDALKQEFMEKYTKDFNITGGSLEIYLGMQVEQSPGKIRLHLNIYIQEALDENKAFQTKSLRPKVVPIQPGLVLVRTIVLFFLTQGSRSSIDRSSLNFNSQQHGFVLISHLLWLSWLDSVHRLRK